MKRNEYNTALDFYTKAIQLNPKSAAYYSNRALVHIKLDNFSGALTDAQKSIDCDESYIKAYYKRAEANMHLHRYKDAVADYELLQSKESSSENLNLIYWKLVELNKIIKGPDKGKFLLISVRDRQFLIGKGYTK